MVYLINGDHGPHRLRAARENIDVDTRAGDLRVSLQGRGEAQGHRSQKFARLNNPRSTILKHYHLNTRNVE